MPESEPSPRQTLAVLLGASTFRRAPKLAQGKAFYNSAQDFREYLMAPEGLGLPSENVNWLFDDSRSPSDQLQDIGDFLETRSTELKSNGTPPQDLIVYYVGHGLFSESDQAYCLAVRGLDEQSKGLTSIRGSDLASIIKAHARFLRKFLILDCCFSAAAYKEFQSGPLQAGRVKLFEEFPRKGTTLLCSASAQDVSIAPEGLARTMFSDSLLKALRQGCPALGSRLSLNELGDLVKLNLREAYPDTGVRPEVQSPDQREGDVASVPLFPNVAYVAPKKAEEARQKAKAEREQKITEARQRAKAERKAREAEEARQKDKAEREQKITEARQRAEAERKARKAEETRQTEAETGDPQREPQQPLVPYAAVLRQPDTSRKKYLALLFAALSLGVGLLLLSGTGRDLLGSLRMRVGLAPKLQLVLQVQAQNAIKSDADQVINSLRDNLREANIRFASVDRNDPSSVEQADTIRINLKGIPHARQADLQALVNARCPGWSLQQVGEADYALTRTAPELAVMKKVAVDGTLAAIQKRLEALGFDGRAFRRPGTGAAEYEIVVQFRGQPADLARATRVLTAGGRLEITLVVGGPFVSQENGYAKYGGVLPPNSKFAAMDANGAWYLLTRTPVITDRDLVSAQPLPDENTGKFETLFKLNSDGAHRFSLFTEANIGNSLAIVLDDRVHEVGIIQSRIEDSGVISNLSSEKAKDLALVLRSGELPVEVVVVPE